MSGPGCRSCDQPQSGYLPPFSRPEFSPEQTWGNGRITVDFRRGMFNQLYLKKYPLMKKLLLIVLSVATIHQLVTGQSNFVSSVVIDNNGDSIHGSIDYRNWKKNPQVISFLNAASERHSFDASAIRGFYVLPADEVYESHTVTIDMLPGDQDEAIKGNYVDSPVVNKRVFLLQLVRHPQVRLYQFTDDHKEHFYYVAGKKQPVELIHHYLYDDSRRQVIEDLTFQEQLNDLFAACPALEGTFKKTKYKKVEIQNSLLKYLQCTAPGSVINVKKKDPVSVKFGVLAGLMFNTFKFEGTASIVDDNYTSSLSPTIGVSFDIGLSRNRNQWHIVNELLYKSYKTKSSFSRPYNNTYSVDREVDLNFSYVQLNSLLRYVVQTNSFLKPYINLGIGNGLMVFENENSSHEVYSFGKEEDVKGIDGPGKYEFSLLGGMGLSERRFQVELRYGRSKKSFSPYHSLDVNPKSIQVLVNYQF
jgi:hypothetical protein